jgi:hypothetical protein
MPQQKTYWHLLRQRRMPTEYEIVTSKLLCYTGEGFTRKRFELDVPLKDWYRRYQEEPVQDVSNRSCLKTSTGSPSRRSHLRSAWQLLSVSLRKPAPTRSESECPMA